MFADLHLHTTASDGLYTPTEVVVRSKEKGFSAISITDHDTIAGIEEAMSVGAKLGLEIMPGIELSTLNEDREIHILGYYPDIHNIKLNEMLGKMIDVRKSRALFMVEKLNNLGFGIALERVKEIAGSEFIGRPHIARALQEKGYISEIAEAFTKDYIGLDGRAYIKRFKMSPVEAIDILKQANAVPVLAHPGFLSQGRSLLENEIKPLIENGLLGIEVFYSKHDREQEDYYKHLAEEHDLLITGGSDWHGQNCADNFLGSIKLPYHYVEALKKKAGAN